MRIFKSKINDEISKITLESSKTKVEILNLGATIKKILTEDSSGNLENIVLTYGKDENYIVNPSSFGATIGRVAGRIGGASFTINNTKYELCKNNNHNCLHGGFLGFSKKIWNYEIEERENEVSVILNYISKDGEEGFPGELNVEVKYTLNNKNELKVEYKANTNKDTLINLTNHSYFNLSGDRKENVLNQKLIINGDSICELDEYLIPTGNLINVSNTPFDFRKEKLIGKDIYKENEQLKIGSGYDHPWLLNGKGEYDVLICHEESGRVMEVKTNQKAVVCYSMNFPDELPLEDGKIAKKHDGICFEVQGLPIGYDDCFIEEAILKAGKEYKKETIFRFYVK